VEYNERGENWALPVRGEGYVVLWIRALDITKRKIRNKKEKKKL
jgi:hypothetical protein